jgi:predicted Holliday junction resolvase-like endonuclease
MALVDTEPMKAVIALVLIAVIIIIAMGMYIHQLRRTLRGVKDPLVFLSARERRAYARELLARERDRYEAERQEKLNEIIWNRGTEDT